MNISSLLDDNIKRYREYQSIYYDGKWKTNVEVHQDSGRLGNLLISLGIRKGDRVIIQMLNSPEVLISFTAINRIGAIVVPLSPLLRPEQASYIFRDSGAKAILTSLLFLEGIRKAQSNAPDLKHIVVVDKDDAPHTIPYQKRIQECSSDLETVETDNDDTAALIYTAGTTGDPKGVMHSHFSLYINTLSLYEYLLVSRPRTVSQTVSTIDPITYQWVEEHVLVTGLNRNTISLGVLPLSHIYGIAFMNASALVGGKSIVHPWWDVSKALQDIQNFGITYIAMVPTMYIQILNHPDLDKYDLSTLEGCTCGSAPLPLNIANKWLEKVGVEIREGWGMTETGATTTGQPPNQPPKYGSIGKSLFKCNTVTIFNEKGQPAAPNEKGEIVVKGPTVMKGYWNKPEDTEEAIRNGWLHTGDIGYKDEDGYIFLTDRKKDIIIRGGENVSPREVEEVLFKHPKVAEAGVVGIEDDVYGEEIMAFLVLKEGQQVKEEEVIAFCKEHLPNFKTPKKIQILEALPKNPVGKLLRRELKKLVFI